MRNWRWAGVPFYLRTGKRMDRRTSEIVVVFKHPPHAMFPHSEGETQPNRLHIQVQPDEGMRLHLTAKEPGPGGIRLRPVSLDLSYATAFDERSPDAYERLLMDVMRGNPTLFMRRDEVEAAWTWVAARSSSGGPRRPDAPSATRPAPAGRPPPRCSSSGTAEPGRSPTSEHLYPQHPTHPSAEPRGRRRDRAPRRAQRRPAGRRTSPGSAPPATAAPPAASSAAPTSRTASPPPSPARRQALRGRTKPNVAIVTSYNDMLSAHQPFGDYPPVLKKAVDPGRRHRAGRRRRAGHVRRHHAGP